MTNTPEKYLVCPNCDQELKNDPKYCPNCGQQNSNKNTTMYSLLLEFLGDYFTFDSKIFKSIIPLIFSPGKMTEEFNQGKRARFIPPLRLFIFISIVFFFLLSLSGTFSSEIDLDEAVVVTDKEKNDDGVNYSWSTEKQQNDGIIRIHTGDSSAEATFNWDEVQRLSKFYPADVVADSIVGSDDVFTHFIVEQLAKMEQTGTKGFGSYLLSNGSLAILFTIPIFAFFLLVLYAGRKIHYVAHFIFSLHFHSFFLLWLLPYVFQSIFDFELPLWFRGPYFLLLLFYVYKSLRRVYGGSRWSIIWREMVLFIVYGIVLFPLVMLSTIVMSVILY